MRLLSATGGSNALKRARFRALSSSSASTFAADDDDDDDDERAFGGET
jgi:hypothetical protein